MSDPQTDRWPKKHLDFEYFPENLELAKNLQERAGGIENLGAYRQSRIEPLGIFKNILAVERYVTQLYTDVKYNAAQSAMGLCTGVAAEGFLISLNCAPRFYREAEDVGEHPVDKDIITFVKKMGDSIAMNEIDLDLGSGRWTASTDLLMDMLAALNVVAASVIMGAENPVGENPAEQIDVEYSVITGCTLIAAYAMILYQCVKDGVYRGQTLTDIRP